MRDAFSRSGCKRWFARRSRATHALAIFTGAVLAHVSFLAAAAAMLAVVLWPRPARAIVISAQPLAWCLSGERFRKSPTRENALAFRRAVHADFPATIPAAMRALAAELERAAFVPDEAFPAAADRVLAAGSKLFR